ncbi:MAG: aminoacyl-tRNA hydrolase [Leptothrix ochracea]|uniref:aminoacyl-tRNA hydrolase n=1 Tax=Leptothrix ochracea TaxID=735331 RepID=UPI0034E1A7EB
MIRLFVGLGNPGFEYEQTRHNAGFWWMDQLAKPWHATLTPDRNYHGLVARVNHPQGPVWLLQPQTYMNLSGKSVAALARFFKIAPHEILVAHDELDLPPGQMKLKQGGSAAGHNGLKDMQAQLGSTDFWRLRLGIGHPGARGEVSGYVLGKPSLDDRIAIDRCIEDSLKATETFLSGDMSKAMALLHAKPQRPKPPKQTPSSSGAASPTRPKDTNC